MHTSDRLADPTRRRLLATAAAASSAALWPTLTLAGSAGPDRPRFVLVILRGGLDGLGAVPAIGDADFAAARGPLATYASPPLVLDPTFALHPNLLELHRTYRSGHALVVHATGLAYRERSHFDAQQTLESGGTRPYELQTGWLGRALALQGSKGMALSTAVPLVLRGSAEVDTWAPSVLPSPSADLVARLERMYASDAQLATALDRARRLHLEALMAEGGAMRAPVAATGSNDAGGSAMNAMAASDTAGAMNAMAAPAGNAPRAGGFVTLSRRAAEFLVQPNGPQAAVLEAGGWDTHANQANPNGALAFNLRQLDAGLAALRDALVAGGVWSQTIIVVATEFGREVAVNGTLGTDHGTGGAALVLGGRVLGGRVVADWPGVAKANRFEGRDLRTTTDLRAVLKGVLADHLRIPPARLGADVFPGSEAVKPISLLG